MRTMFLAALPVAILAGCNSADGIAAQTRSAAAPGAPFQVTEIADFDEPWAMAFIPGAGQALITEKKGKLLLWDDDGAVIEVAGVPRVSYGGQGGLGDVVLHPGFANNSYVYLSWIEAGANDMQGAVIGRAKLVIEGDKPRLDGMQIIWRQEPKVSGSGHFAHRMAFSPDGYLFVTSGDRQKFTPAQDMNQNLGKVIRLTDAGGIPSDNPYYDQGRIKAQIWSSGHRNPLGIAFNAGGQLWTNEMGPKGGDELNRIERGSNYGYPIVSNGDHYDGRDIPDHGTRPEFNAPELSWTPVISPSSMIFYSGARFRDWNGNALIGALSGKALVRVAFDGNSAREVARYDMGARIREVEQSPDGAIWLLEDGNNGSRGRLLKLTPKG